MKNRIIPNLALVLVSVSGLPSIASASAGGREDYSPLVVLAFLAFCALIVVLQLIPAIRSSRLALTAERENDTQEPVVQTAKE